MSKIGQDCRWIVLKKLPTWGRGVSKIRKNCQHCLWMVFLYVAIRLLFFIFEKRSAPSCPPPVLKKLPKLKISKGLKTLTVEKLKGRKNVKLRAWDEVATSWFPELSSSLELSLLNL